jgi:hypothetical protein
MLLCVELLCIQVTSIAQDLHIQMTQQPCCIAELRVGLGHDLLCWGACRPNVCSRSWCPLLLPAAVRHGKLGLAACSICLQ